MILLIGGAFQGKKKLAREYIERTGKHGLEADFHRKIRDALMTDKDPEEIVRQLLQEPPAVVTMDEIGYGIVPMEKNEREYREAVGHAGQLLAAYAQEVYRVVAGIAVRIK